MGGRTPTPRKLSAASVLIIPGISSVVYAMTGPEMLGSTCRVRICQGPLPQARAASTNSRWRRERASARTTRAMPGQPKTPMTTVISTTRLTSWATDIIAIMKMSEGKDMVRSISLLSTVSTRPPK